MIYTYHIRRRKIQEEDIYMNIDLCFWNNFTSEIIPLSWPCSHSGYILSELMCTNETQYILAICHVTDWNYLDILQNSQTQLLFTHSETLYFLHTCWILRGSNHYSFCVEKNQDCCLKKNTDEVVFHLEDFVHEARLEGKHLHTLLRDFWCPGQSGASC